MAVRETAPAESRQRRRYPTGFPVRCTEAEKQQIFAQAEQANRSASRFLVELAIRFGKNGIGPRPSREELYIVEGLMVQLRRLATNLHELAARDYGYAEDDADALIPTEIREAVLDVRRMLDQLRSHLA